MYHQGPDTGPSPWDPGSNASYSAQSARRAPPRRTARRCRTRAVLPAMTFPPPASCSELALGSLATRVSLTICRVCVLGVGRFGRGGWLLLDLLGLLPAARRSMRTSAQLQVVHATSSASQRMHQSHPPTRKAGVHPVSRGAQGLAAKSRRAGVQERRSGMSGWGSVLLAATRDCSGMSCR